MTRLVQTLPDGTYDIVGDIHGHSKVLASALLRLGYSETGLHSQGRRLIFVGDLVDRGPNSIQVVDQVATMVQAGRAYCVLGNHELNLLLGSPRQGNQWWFGQAQYVRGTRRVLPQAHAKSADRQRMLAFFGSLPLALESPSLKVVHACWHPPSLERLRHVTTPIGAWTASLDAQLIASNPHPRKTPEWEMVLQNQHPVRILTSGIEAPWDGPAFLAGGRPRQLIRDPWWDSWREVGTVVFGHYWRSQDPTQALTSVPGPFAPRTPSIAPLGPRGNAWCVDYSNGHRSEEALLRPWSRATVAALGVLRWPERELVLI